MNIYKSTATNMAKVRLFEVVFKKLDEICISEIYLWRIKWYNNDVKSILDWE
jgi:hypothetical protein